MLDKEVPTNVILKPIPPPHFPSACRHLKGETFLILSKNAGKRARKHLDKILSHGKRIRKLRAFPMCKHLKDR